VGIFGLYDSWTMNTCMYMLMGLTTLAILVPLYIWYMYSKTVKPSESKKRMIKKLVRQAARWSTASKQDESHLIAVLHANYGAGYLWALKDIASNREIEMAAGVDAMKFEREIISVQDNATTLAIKECPLFGPPSTYLSRIGGE
jgi:hypothetical protein